jgi:hypothetical protein
MAYVSGIDSGMIVKKNSEYTKNIKSFTNNDPSYTYEGTFRRPRPIKHYRKGYPSTFESDKQTISGNGMPRLLTNMQEMPGTSVSGLGTCKEGVACSTELLNGSAPCFPGGVVYRPNDCRAKEVDPFQPPTTEVTGRALALSLLRETLLLRRPNRPSQQYPLALR